MSRDPLYIVETPAKSTDSAEPSATEGRGPTKRIPLCCQRCAHYRPTFFLKIGRECAAFGTVTGVLDDRCGFYAPK